MATAAAEHHDRNVSIGRIFGRAFGTIGSNPVATLGIAFLFGALPSLLIAYGMQSLRTQDFTPTGGLALIAVSLASALIAVALAMITQGALVRATVAHSEGREASFGESAMAGLSVALPLFLLALLSGIAIAFGLLLLVVPGVILYIMWSAAAPALVEEKLGVFEALGRSSDLTRGARWKVFGLSLVVLVIYWLFSALVGMLSLMMYGGVTQFAQTIESGLPLGYLLISAVSGTITSAVWGVIQSSLYVELRDWKDGPASDKLAEIFG